MSDQSTQSEISVEECVKGYSRNPDNTCNIATCYNEQYPSNRSIYEILRDYVRMEFGCWGSRKKVCILQKLVLRLDM